MRGAVVKNDEKKMAEGKGNHRSLRGKGNGAFRKNCQLIFCIGCSILGCAAAGAAPGGARSSLRVLLVLLPPLFLDAKELVTKKAQQHINSQADRQAGNQPLQQKKQEQRVYFISWV